MRHYVLTRSAYGPAYPIEANHWRLDLLRGITARSLAAQTERRWTWLVLVDEADPLLAERVAILRSVGVEVVLVHDPSIARTGIADAPQGRWADFIEWDEGVLTTRLDDDDALGPKALGALQAAATGARGRVVWVLPSGFRVADGRVNAMWHPKSQFVSLQVPANDRATIMDTSHLRTAALARPRIASPTPQWLWVRHREARTESGPSSQRGRSRMRRISDDLRRTFDVDWELLA